MKSKKLKQMRPTTPQTPSKINPLEPAIENGADSRPLSEEVVAILDNNNLKDKDSGFRYLSSVITECLVSHIECTGTYASCIASFILKCKCPCHRKTGFQNPNSEPQSRVDSII